MQSMNAVAEGVLTSRSAYNLANNLQQECPIIKGIYRIIHRKFREGYGDR
jgi:glycerol-3-phosphate dehydrogenase